MDPTSPPAGSPHPTPELIEPVLSLAELAAHLSVSVQTLYDLRSKGRGPHGFRVGRELRFRRGEIEAWLARMEAADQRLHPPDTRGEVPVSGPVDPRLSPRGSGR